jgi:tyrosyl-tRNA synthetase
MAVDMEVGGADQIFNMLMGRALSRIYLGKEKFVRANKMMEAPDGKTMSKTRGNGINLSDDAATMYGKAMSYPDSAIIAGLELLTEVPMEQIAEIKTAMAQGENPMPFKKLMAFEIVKIIKGEDAARKAEEGFFKVFQRKQKPEGAIKIQKSEGSGLELLLRIGAAKSKSEARRLFEQGAVKLNGVKITNWKDALPLKSGDVLKVGALKFFEVE